MSHQKVGERIKAFRIQSGISQDELSQSTQLSLRTIQRIENGETEPRGDSLKRIAKALNIEMRDLADTITATKLKEDKSILLLIKLSAFGYLIYPFIGIIFPMILWIFYKEKVTGADEAGKKVIKYQSVWFAFLAIFYLYLVIIKINHLYSPIVSNKTIIAVIICLYVFNAIMILLQSFKLSSMKKFERVLHGI
ncbi:MAG: helix-turn-helix domain-containing protein [Flavisolibacter sp.]